MAGGGKAKAAAAAGRPQTTLVLDNGGYTLKAGVAGGDGPAVVPNCLARDRARRVYVGADVRRCRDYGEMHFRRPVEKGFIVGWEAQKEIWDHELFGASPICDPADARLVLAEPPNGLPALQANCDQVVFEEYGFASYYRGVGTHILFFFFSFGPFLWSFRYRVCLKGPRRCAAAYTKGQRRF